MGIFTVDVKVCRPGRRPRWAVFDKVIVDTGCEATWLPGADLLALGIDVFKADQTLALQEVVDVGCSAEASRSLKAGSPRRWL